MYLPKYFKLPVYIYFFLLDFFQLYYLENHLNHIIVKLYIYRPTVGNQKPDVLETRTLRDAHNHIMYCLCIMYRGNCQKIITCNLKGVGNV